MFLTFLPQSNFWLTKKQGRGTGLGASVPIYALASMEHSKFQASCLSSEAMALYQARTHGYPQILWIHSCLLFYPNSRSAQLPLQVVCAKLRKLSAFALRPKTAFTLSQHTQWNLGRRGPLATLPGKLEPRRSVLSSGESFQSLTPPFLFTLSTPLIFFLG